MFVDLHATVQIPVTVMLWMTAVMWVARGWAFGNETLPIIGRLSQYMLGVYFICLAIKQQWWSIRWHLLAMGSDGIADAIQVYGLLIPITANLFGIFAGAVVLAIATRPFFGRWSGHIVGGSVCCLLLVGAYVTGLGR